MRIIMTIKTFREFAHHGLWMRYTMTVLAGGQVAVFVFVAEYALQRSMLGGPGSQQGCKIAMTGTAILIRYGFTIGNIQRLMNLMAGNTVCKDLTGTVRFMTLLTVGNISMLVMMTDRTVKSAMGTWIVFYFIYLRGMTGVAHCDVIITKDNAERLVRVLMTAKTVVYLKMRFALMTHGTLRYHVFFRRGGGMTIVMTVNAADLCFVFSTVIHVLMDNFRMTFYAVTAFQHRICSPGTSH